MQLHIRMEEEGPAGVHAGVSTWAEVCACGDESRLPSQVVGNTRCQVSIILKTSGKLRGPGDPKQAGLLELKPFREAQ